MLHIVFVKGPEEVPIDIADPQVLVGHITLNTEVSEAELGHVWEGTLRGEFYVNILQEQEVLRQHCFDCSPVTEVPDELIQLPVVSIVVEALIARMFGINLPLRKDTDLLLEKSLYGVRLRLSGLEHDLILSEADNLREKLYCLWDVAVLNHEELPAALDEDGQDPDLLEGQVPHVVRVDEEWLLVE